jgi:hypothetical protein
VGTSAVFSKYFGPARTPFGFGGLAIYFAASGSVYQKDAYATKGYNKNNQDHSVDFVNDANVHWADFLRKYWNIVK